MTCLGQAEVQDLDTVLDTAKAFARARASAVHRGEIVVSARPLDPRLRLAACHQPLTAFTPPGGREIGHVSVGIKCANEPQWKLYVTVKVQAFGDVIKLRQGIPRGETIGQDDVVIAQANLADLAGGYLTDPADAIGKIARRSLRANEILTSSAIEAPNLVKRGQIVVLFAERPGLTVRASGQALDSGAKGERIRVRNSRSGRIVEGTVTATGAVRVDL